MRCEEGAVLECGASFPWEEITSLSERRHWHRSRRSVAWAAAFRTAVAPWPAVLRPSSELRSKLRYKRFIMEAPTVRGTTSRREA